MYVLLCIGNAIAIWQQYNAGLRFLRVCISVNYQNEYQLFLTENQHFLSGYQFIYITWRSIVPCWISDVLSGIVDLHIRPGKFYWVPGIYGPGIYGYPWTMYLRTRYLWVSVDQVSVGIYGPGIYGPGVYGPGVYGPGIYGPGIYGPGIKVSRYLGI